MIPVLIEAAFRSLLAGLVVALGLRIFRVHNVVAQKAAWGLVLTAALSMPWLLPTVGRWQLLPSDATITLPAHPMTLLEELQARILAKNPSGRLPQPNAWTVQQEKPIEESASAETDTERTPADKVQPAPAPRQEAAGATEAMVDSGGRREDSQG